MRSPRFWLMVLLCLTGAAACNAQYKTFVLSGSDTNYPSATNFIVGPNKVVEFVGGSYSLLGPAPDSDVDVNVVLPDTPGSTNFTRRTAAFSVHQDIRIPFFRAVVGPVLIDLSIYGTKTGIYTVKISDQAETVTPNTAVVIPSDAKGPVNIVMESSTNLVNWTGALPGTYGASAASRYFRLRAVAQ